MKTEKNRGTHSEVADALVETLRRTMRVAEVDEMGEFHPMKQTTLSDQTGVGISSVRKYLRRGSGVKVNPSLENLCRIADILKVPPAFLLMRPQDWTRLASAAEWWPRLATDVSYGELVEEMWRQADCSPASTASAAQELAALMGLNVPAALPRGASNPLGKHPTGLPTVSVLPPYSEIDDNWHPVIHAICAVIGSSIQER